MDNNIITTAIYLIVMLCFFASGLIYLLKSMRELGKDKKDLKTVQSRFSGKDSYTEVSSSASYNSQIISKWIRYCSSQVKARRTASIEVLENILYDISGKYDSIIKFTITALILLGLLGTFAGMTFSIWKASNIVKVIQVTGTKQENSFGNISDMNGQNTSGKKTTDQKFGELMKDLEPVLAGMNIAFITSIFGLVTSLVLNIVLTKHSHSRDEFRLSALEFANEVLIPVYTPETEKSIGSVIEKYTQDMKEALERIEKASQDTFTQVKEQLDQTANSNVKLIEGFINGVRAENEKLLEQISQSMERLIKGNLSGFQEESAKITEKLESAVNSLKEVSERFALNSDSIDSFIEKISESSDKMLSSSFELSSNMSSIGDMIGTVSILSERINLLSSLINRMNPKDPLGFNIFEQIQDILIGLSNNIVNLNENISSMKNIALEPVKNDVIPIETPVIGDDIKEIFLEINRNLEILSSKPSPLTQMPQQQTNNDELTKNMKSINKYMGEIVHLCREKSKPKVNILKKLGLVR